MPKNKKEESSDSDSGPEDRGPAKKSKSEAGSSAGKNASGESEWFLDNNKKVTVREFKNRVFVDIREFYEKDGKQLPGKKGISLQVPLWKKLVELSGEITEATKKF